MKLYLITILISLFSLACIPQVQAQRTTVTDNLRVKVKIDLNGKTVTDWNDFYSQAGTPGGTLHENDLWYNSSSALFYVYNGSAWAQVTSAGISDGDKGDITVSGSGLVWTIDAGVITLAMLNFDPLLDSDTATVVTTHYQRDTAAAAIRAEVAGAGYLTTEVDGDPANEKNLDDHTGTIATAQIEDGAVSLAKQASGTADRLQGFDGSGDPSEITAGTNVSISGGTISATGGIAINPNDDYLPLRQDATTFVNSKIRQNSTYTLVDVPNIYPAGGAPFEVGHNAASSWGTVGLFKQYEAGNSDGVRVGLQKHTPAKKWSFGITDGATTESFSIAEDGGIGSTGTGRFFIAPGGNVGMGTSSPRAQLQIDTKSSVFQVANQTYITENLYHDGTDFRALENSYTTALGIGHTSNRGVSIFTLGGTTMKDSIAAITERFRIGFSDLNFYGLNGGDNTLNTNGSTNHLRIQTGGNYLGIGNTTPSKKFQITEPSVHQFRTAWDASNHSDIYTASTGYLNIDASGNRIYMATDDDLYFQGDGNLFLPPGGATVPSIAGNGDTNTGFYFPAADNFGISTAGVERMVINAAGEVGIGGAPIQDLTVHGNGYFTGGGTLFLDTEISSGGGSTKINIQNNEPMKITTGGFERIRIDTSGKMGIGTTAPLRLLDVRGKILANRTSVSSSDYDIETGTLYTADGFKIGNIDVANQVPQDRVSWYQGVDKIRMYNGATGRFSIDPLDSFNLLVGGDTDNGVDKLQVTGNASLTGNLKVATIPNATTDTDKFLVDDSDELKYRTAAELRSDLDIFGTSGTFTVTAPAQDTIKDLGGTTTGSIGGTFSRIDNLITATVSFLVCTTSGRITTTMAIAPPTGIASDFTSTTDVRLVGGNMISEGETTGLMEARLIRTAADTSNDEVDAKVYFGSGSGPGSWPNNRFECTVTFRYLIQ